MVIDYLKNSDLYKGTGDKIAAALEYLQQNDFLHMEQGKYLIDDSRIYSLVQHYESLPAEQGLWEAHRRYIDIHYIADGEERMGYANLDHMKVTREYSDEDDCLLLGGDGEFFTARKGAFVIFYPWDVHMPCLAVTKPMPVKKIVVKVLMD